MNSNGKEPIVPPPIPPRPTARGGDAQARTEQWLAREYRTKADNVVGKTLAELYDDQVAREARKARRETARDDSGGGQDLTTPPIIRPLYGHPASNASLPMAPRPRKPAWMSKEQWHQCLIDQGLTDKAAKHRPRMRILS